jgi:hypothetical protein
VAVIAAFFARAASERPPYTTERTLLWFAVAGWVLASLVVALLARGGRRAALGLWSIHTMLALIAYLLTTESLLATDSKVRVAPPVILAGVASQLAGLIAIVLDRRRNGKIGAGSLREGGGGLGCERGRGARRRHARRSGARQHP